jgi:hypothetical protein
MQDSLIGHLKIQNVGETGSAEPDCACPWIQLMGRFSAAINHLGRID